jgi:dihydrodipicolinate synthase/N-acetylneuraminate lyase
VRVYSEVANEVSALLAFELGEMFADFGQIYDLETVKGLIEIPTLLGMKHSSLDRQQEWARLVLRDERRPEFKIYTGNDLAIDMIMYGSDYLLGLSAFAPGEFAHRDRMWQEGRSDFYSLNDLLQYLGYFAFRPPVPAYKHSAAQFLNIRGWIPNDLTHPRSARRPNTDKEILEGILRKLECFA